MGLRSSALWGSRGRLPLLLCLVVALATPVAAQADKGKPTKAVVPQFLLDDAAANPKKTFDVIVQGDGSTKSDKLAKKIAQMLALDGGTPSDAKLLGGQVRRLFSTIDGFDGRFTGKQLVKIAKTDGILSITPNATVSAAQANPQLWPDETGVSSYWGSSYAATPAGTIAVVDSGVDASTFGSRLLTQVNMVSSDTVNSPGDGYGHGTFVASIAAGDGAYGGVAPSANIVALDVIDDSGGAKTADVIAAADWIYQHRSDYNIKVANFSIHSGIQASFMYDPLDKAVEKLWLSGVFVVAAAGNYAVDGLPSGVSYAPGNDPFVMTVGALDVNDTTDPGDDFTAPWSAFGYTPDGFAKPDIGAPGRYVIGSVPTAAFLAAERPDHVVGPNLMQLSGTSFSAPQVAGAGAVLMGEHPDWTPDQVKGALMLSASPLPLAAPGSAGVGELNLQQALQLTDPPPNPNAALDQFLVSDPSGDSTPVVDTASWASTVETDASWASASWASASWASASWASASWASASWASASWASASWASASWASASLADASIPDMASGDRLGHG